MNLQPFFRASLAAVLLAALPISAQQGTIQGTVTDGEDATPLPNANLNLVGTVRGTVTSDDGTFSLAVPPGSYTLQATFIGYQSAKQSVEVAVGETATIDFSLNASAVALGEEFVVVGSRTVRTAIETPAPVDVISELEIRQSGQTEINQTLRQLAPSFNASHQTITDGTDHINPASLRGLGPDQVLVLINGKRRHSSALVHVNGTFGRGTVGVDLNAIPKAAVERIEILRDGAAAQYGSDAIAGVINIVLKDNTEGIQLNNLVGTTAEGDGEQVKTDVNYGFKWNIENTNNASMGADSPTSFHAGRLGFNQTSGNLDLVRPLDTGLFERTSLVLGGEFRVENYQIEAGQFESYSYGRGPVDGTNFEEGKASGAQVFRGFSPASALNRFRNSISTYAGLETQASAMLTVDVGGRFEQYSDFGSTATGKLALRLALSDALALRATASKGFRAPSLHQVWFNSVSTQFVADEVTGELVPREVLTANNSSPVLYQCRQHLNQRCGPRGLV